ncbi:MAG: hypothetical protein ACOC0R_05540, partial [Mariniphaga sp.]
VLERWQGEHRIIAGINFSNEKRKLDIPVDYHAALKKIVDSNDEQWKGTGEVSPDIITGNEEVNVEERSFLIYSTDF